MDFTFHTVPNHRYKPGHQRTFALINMLLPPFSNSSVSLWISEYFKTEEKLLPADLKMAQIYTVAGAMSIL